MSKMKCLIVVLIIIASSFQNKIFATHAAGADLQYRWLFGRTYEVTVSFFRDCSGVAAPPSISLSAVAASCGLSQDYTLNLVPGAGQEITFPCRSVQTICSDPGSPYAGYEQYIYRNNITLPQNCIDWTFSFFICCRNCAITTIDNPCTENLYIEATLNNVDAPTNSSPHFTNIPVAFLCINQSSTYNHGVIDSDGDSLAYSFITPRSYNNATFTVSNVNFKPGFSASSPMTSAPPVSLDPYNGDIIVNPTINGEIGIAAILVREYRNGILIGSVVRDMQFITKVCNPNFLPTATGINGTAVFDTTICPGSLINFNINSGDGNAADTVTMDWNDAITGAIFNTAGATRPTGTFSWTPSSADARTQPYTFTVTVRDNACPLNGSQTYSYSILVPDVSASVSSSLFNGYNVACRGAGTASATVTGSGGGLPYTYNWNPTGQSTQTAIGLLSGSYTATVTDVHGCTATVSANITEPPTDVSISVSAIGNVSCNGGSDGSATVSGAGGVGSITYSWSSGQTTAAISGLSANNYTVTVTDANGCTAQQSIVINQPSTLNASISSFQNVSCQNNANGSISTSVNGGTGPYTHHWSNGASTDNITGLGPGTYTDTIRDTKGCTRIISQVITEPGSSVGIPSSSVSTSDVSCNGLSDGVANVNPVGGTFPYTVTWSNGDIGLTADSLPAGNYNVHIVDGNGCTFDSIITIDEPDVLVSSFINVSTSPSGSNIRCFGDTTGRVRVVLTGGTPPFTYAWSNGATIDSINNVGAGTYNVQVTDDNGCTTADTITLTQPSAILDDSLLVKHVGCKGESSGGIRAVTFGGSPSYTYVWSSGTSVMDSIGDLPAGFYQVTISDTNNCQLIDTVTIQEPDTIVPLISPSTYIGSVNIGCNGDSTGSATINVIGGTPPFTYLWSTNSTDSFASGLSAGTVSVRVVDANGCSIIRDTNLVEPLPFFYGPTVHQPECYGSNDGYIILNTSGSTGPYTYNWSNSGTTDSVGSLTSGFYSVIVLDANNCRDSLAYTLTDPDSITVHATVSDFQGFNNRCNGDSSSFITVNPTGGTGFFTYLWSNSATTDSIGNLPSGNYSVTITDGNGCTQDTSFNIIQPPPLNNNVTLSVFSGGANVSCNGFIDGVAHANPGGGVPPYQYLWSNGDVADSAVGLGAGAHSVMVTDSNGCSISMPFTLTEPVPVSLSSTLSDFNGFNTACSGDSSGCITVNTAGGTMPYSYIWDVIDTITTPTVCNLPADTFNLRILDANGCQLDTFFILSMPPPVNTGSVVSDFGGFGIQCFGLNNGYIDVSVGGGVTPFNYNWSNGATTEDLNNLGAGTYTVIIADANSCSDTMTFVMAEPPVLSSSVSSVTEATCNGLNDGVAVISQPAGGVTPYTYLWSNGESGLTASMLPVGNNFVVITDANNCIDTIFVTIAMGECVLELPTAITPNGDGFNDVYIIHGLSKYPNNFFKVFNRWGNEVFSQEDYSNTEWYGQDSDGGNLPDGTYFVTFVVKGEDIQKNTYVDLRR